MDKLEKYRQIICQILTPYVNITYSNVPVHNRAAFDQENDQYLIISEGWNKSEHLHSCLIHLEIYDEFFSLKFIEKVIQQSAVKLIIYQEKKEIIVQWTD